MRIKIAADAQINTEKSVKICLQYFFFSEEFPA